MIVKKQLLIKLCLFINLFSVSLVVNAGLIGTNQCLLDASGVSGCTAGDVGVNNIRITKLIDGCVSNTDTAIINMEVDINSANPTRYNIGIYIDLNGGDAVATGNTCVHEALFPVGANGNLQANRESGIGNFLIGENKVSDQNTCGDVENSLVYTRRIVDGDVSGGSTTAQNLTVLCSDVSGNGFLDVGWAVSWRQNAGNACSSIAQAIPGTSSKCQANSTDSAAVGNPIPIGVPDISLTIVCTPSTVNLGDTLSCTVDYSNTGLGPADFIEFHIDYPQAQGSVTNIVAPGTDTATDTASDYINWQIGGTPTLANLAAGASGQLTFDFIVGSSLEAGTITNTVTAYYNNSTDPVLEQTALTASSTVTLNPVTIAYVHPQLNETGIDIQFGTATETSNIGFNIYAIADKSWIKLNKQMIRGALDSLRPQDYEVNVANPLGADLAAIGIAGVDVDGNEDRHGPFALNQLSGTKIVAKPVNWAKVNKQVTRSRQMKRMKRALIKRLGKKSFVNANVAHIDTHQNTVYRITHQDLMAIGVNLIGQKAKEIAMSLQGQAIPRHIDHLTKSKRWQEQSWLEFMGSAPTAEDALYVDYARYQLSVDKTLVYDVARIESSNLQHLVIEQNNRYAFSIPGDDPFYDAFFYMASVPGTLVRNFDLPGLLPSDVKLTVLLSSLAAGTHHVIATLNGVQVAHIEAKDWSSVPIEIVADQGLLKEAGNTLVLTITDTTSDFSIFIYDKLIVDYPSSQKAEFEVPLLTKTESIDPNALLPTHGETLVIISHPLFIDSESLNRFISQRKTEGWQIKVVDVEDIYEVYGGATPVAIKKYLKQAKAYGVTHVQLVGAASYDYHDYLQLGSISLIPSIYATTNHDTGYAPCDACYVLDEQQLPSMAIGRWPVRTQQDLDAVVNKTLAWQNNGQASAHTSLFIADENEPTANYVHQLENIQQQLVQQGSWHSPVEVYLDELIEQQGEAAGVQASRDQIRNALESGASMTIFSGHGSPSVWSFKGMLRQQDIVAINNKTLPTLALPLTCYTTYADSPYTQTLAHQLLATETGAVAIYGAATLSAYSDNGIAVAKAIDGLFEGKTLGQSINDGKRALGVGYNDIITNSNLLGDVTLRLQ